ncbi:hypothetical protein PTKIN_Ptkin05aG0144100 [Pterospermum kingtungense]
MGYLSCKCSYEEVDQKAKALRAAANYTPSEDASPVDLAKFVSLVAKFLSHFAPGKGFQLSNVHVHDLQAFQKDSFNISHKINRLAFGDYFPGVVNPLDSCLIILHLQCNSRIVQWTQEQSSGMYEYFIKVVPTVCTDVSGNTIQSNQTAFILWPINLTLLSSFSITYLHYFIPYGIGATASTRVANEMGAGNAQAAKMAFNGGDSYCKRNYILQSIELVKF